MNTCRYVAAVNEGDAVAIGAGAFLGGQKSVVFMQNSGLTNAASPLTSLTPIFGIPILGLVSLRGEPDDDDEPQHSLMGRITTNMLELMGIPWAYLARNDAAATEQVNQAAAAIGRGDSFFLVIRRGSFSPVALSPTQPPRPRLAQEHFHRQTDNTLPSRYQALTAICRQRDLRTVLLATTGMTGRELYEISDAPNNLYVVGSMGCIASFGLGLAISQPDVNIIVIDGDGSLLMRMGALATNGHYRPPNLLHVVLDNGSYDSTGGQNTVASTVDFVAVASACGYDRYCYTSTLSELEAAIATWKQNQKLTLTYLRVARGTKTPVGRPAIHPRQAKTRLMAFLNHLQ